MKIKVLLTGVLTLGALALMGPMNVRAQQVPYLYELKTRYAAFNTLYIERRRVGSDVSAIDAIRARVELGFQKGDIPAVLESISQGLVSLEGRKWDDTARFLSSLSLETDRLVLDGSQPLGVSLVRMFPVDESKAFPEGVQATFEVIPAADPGQVSQPASQIIIARDMTVSQATTTLARRLPLLNGAYSVVAVIQASGKELARIQTPVYAISDYSDRLDGISRMIADVKRSTDAKVQQLANQVSTAEFQLKQLGELTKGNPRPDLNPLASLERLDSVLRAMTAGSNPLPSERGEIERAYAAADGQVIPYRIYVPQSYDGSRAWPLVIALHGALGDERSYFSGLYDMAAIKGEADRRGYIIATPTWLGRFPNGTAGEDDVLRVLREVQSAYRIDPVRIYLTGHSVGGFGVWQIAFDHPEIFAAIAPVSGGSPVKLDALPNLLARMKAVPVLVLHGAKDGIVPVARSKEIADAARKAGLQITYTEVPGADHTTIVGATFGAILEFFDKHPKPTATNQQ